MQADRQETKPVNEPEFTDSDSVKRFLTVKAIMFSPF